MMVALLSSHIKSAFPDVTVHPFGSFETGLYLPMGDIDLVLESRQMMNSKPRNVLYKLANVIRRGGFTDHVTVIANARVPIVKFVTTAGNFSIDISINQISGVQAREMVKRFIQGLPALRALVFVLKAFLNQREMNEVFSGGLGSYSIVLMSISFLQMHPKIRRGEIDPCQNLGTLILDFFELYGINFNYIQTGICIAKGGS